MGKISIKLQKCKEFFEATIIIILFAHSWDIEALKYDEILSDEFNKMAAENTDCLIIVDRRTSGLLSENCEYYFKRGRYSVISGKKNFMLDIIE